MTYATSKRRDLIGRATFFCLVKLPVRGVTRPFFPLLAKIRGLAREGLGVTARHDTVFSLYELKVRGHGPPWPHCSNASESTYSKPCICQS